MNNQYAPLAERIRPKRIEDIVGQSHLLGPKGALLRLISKGRLPSMIFWGAPGTGKTTLVRILASSTKHEFLEFSGSTGSAVEIKKTINEYQGRTLFRSIPPIVFLDEIHRFNRTQLDILLGPVERGEIILLGATTENPGFHLTKALCSRCQIFALSPPQPEEIQTFLERIWFQERCDEFCITTDITNWLSTWSGGDLRIAITGLEVLMNLEPNSRNIHDLKEALGNHINYDRVGGHYDLASAFQKSIRGSNPDASLYYLSRMIQSGEDPRFITRRLLVCAAEDIGNADPQAFLLAEAASRAVEYMGWPEARIPLAQVTIYLSNAPKSNAVIMAIDAAIAAPDALIPNALTGSVYNSRSKETKNSDNYFDSHHNYERPQEFLPPALQSTVFYRPVRPQERNWRDRLEPNLAKLEKFFTAWTADNPNGGELPLDDWANKLKCNREATARAIDRLSRYNWSIERKLVAKPNTIINQLTVVN